MLITFRFSKQDNGTFVAHTDILRALNRTFRRSGIVVNYSDGFNKHMLLKMTQPLPLGIASNAEYVTADVATAIGTEEFLTLFNENCPPYLHAEKAYVTTEKPKLASFITASKYFFRTEKAIFAADKIERCKDAYSFSYTHRDVTKIIDAASMLHAVKVREDGVVALMSSGSVNLRPDSLAEAWNRDFGLSVRLCDIVRCEQYLSDGNKFLSATEYMEKLS